MYFSYFDCFFILLGKDERIYLPISKYATLSLIHCLKTMNILKFLFDLLSLLCWGRTNQSTLVYLPASKDAFTATLSLNHCLKTMNILEFLTDLLSSFGCGKDEQVYHSLSSHQQTRIHRHSLIHSQRKIPFLSLYASSCSSGR